MVSDSFPIEIVDDVVLKVIFHPGVYIAFFNPSCAVPLIAELMACEPVVDSKGLVVCR
jgi:hypothetical protein